MTVKFMHTIDGEPAYYRPGEQIVFRPSARFAIPLVSSLEQIKAEQQASARYRKEKEYAWTCAYGHLRVEIGQ
jgi:hypothetical protein